MQLRPHRIVLLIVIFVLMLAVNFIASAQDSTAPSVTVFDQLSLDGTVTIASAYSEGPGFMVIHIDDGSGSPGPVAGFRWLNPGWNFNITLNLDTTQATPTMFAMLHEDTGEIGVYEFGTVEGADAPVIFNGAAITPPFTVNLIRAYDQFVESNTVTVANVIIQQPGWLVIHSGDAESFGAVLGATQIGAGGTAEVSVTLEGNATDVLWPMLHVDTGVQGEYEFGTVEGADLPIVLDGVVATTPIWTVPHIRVRDQAGSRGDNTPAEASDAAPSVTAESVLSDGPGFLVIHQEQDGGVGPVAGFTPVNDGLSLNVQVEVDPALITPNLWPMLHVDTGVQGEYQFGTVEGADGPVTVNGDVVTFQISASPFMEFSDQAIGSGNTLFIDRALIDAPGWLAIHSSDNGQPGPVIATYPLLRGLNEDIVITVDPALAGVQVFPMLHYDTGEGGVYEFGTVADTDLPVFVNGEVIVGPLNILDAAAVDDTEAASGDGCTVTPSGSNGANLRTGPGTNFDRAGGLAAGESANVDGQASGGDGYVWYRLASGAWVRTDVVTTAGDCSAVPTVEAPAPPPPPAPPPTQPAAPPPAPPPASTENP